MAERDDGGQPLISGYNVARRRDRDVSEMLGLVKGMISDGVVSADEARFLNDWGARHPDVLAHWPAKVIFARLAQHFADGHIDDDERAELRDLLTAVAGGDESICLGFDGATLFPLDAPAPLVCWQEEVYVFTGRFAYGTRKRCEREVTERGGSCDDNVTRRTSFLVIGTFSSRDWVHSSYGRKIQKAVQLRDSGFSLRIIGEDHWANAISALAV
jgi:NAD-dependent DNA ligase